MSEILRMKQTQRVFVASCQEQGTGGVPTKSSAATKGIKHTEKCYRKGGRRFPRLWRQKMFLKSELLNAVLISNAVLRDDVGRKTFQTERLAWSCLEINITIEKQMYIVERPRNQKL